MKRDMENKMLPENYFLFTGVRSQTVCVKYIYPYVHLMLMCVGGRREGKSLRRGRGRGGSKAGQNCRSTWRTKEGDAFRGEIDAACNTLDYTAGQLRLQYVPTFIPTGEAALK